MFERLLSRFRASEPKPLPQPDADLALGALLVRVAKSDHTYRVEEIQRIDRLIARLFELNPVAAAKMRATCEKLEKQAPGTGSFAALIRDNVDHDHRLDALQAFFEVMLSDGTEAEEEVSLIHALTEALGLSDEDEATARARAIEGHVLPPAHPKAQPKG